MISSTVYFAFYFDLLVIQVSAPFIIVTVRRPSYPYDCRRTPLVAPSTNTIVFVPVLSKIEASTEFDPKGRLVYQLALVTRISYIEIWIVTNNLQDMHMQNRYNSG